MHAPEISTRKKKSFLKTDIITSDKIIISSFLFLYLYQHQTMVSHRICFYRKPCRKVFLSNASYCLLIHISQVKSIQIRLAFWFSLAFCFCFVGVFLPPCILLPKAALITMVDWMNGSSSAIYHSSNDCFLMCLK